MDLVGTAASCDDGFFHHGSGSGFVFDDSCCHCQSQICQHADFLCEVVETCQIDENCVAITQLQGPHKTAPGASFWSLGVVAPNQTCKLGGVFVHCLWGLARTMLLGLFVRKLWRSEDRLLLPTSSNPGTKRPSSTSSIVGASPPT